MFLVLGYIIVIIGMFVSYELFDHLRIDYRFNAPESWSTTCLGSVDTTAELLGWDGVEADSPGISKVGTTSEYRCEWKWWGTSESATDSQEITIEIDVRDQQEYGPYEPMFDDGGWPDYKALNGWEHGTCLHKQRPGIDNSYRCVASESNLRVTIWSRNSSGDSDRDPKYFGPEEKSVEDMTVELGELVRSVFHK
ncbi:hypothetical protein [Glycomyces arizonensis]|uniref:hypothetical protein n=1 Tax=Glycomyces arizonensis TaxID=256035 RepID=UPI0003F6C56E|nr:hypothetical protein [Glycomyces arizonensis]